VSAADDRTRVADEKELEEVVELAGVVHARGRRTGEQSANPPIEHAMQQDALLLQS
jgi:hypothetical protein